MMAVNDRTPPDHLPTFSRMFAKQPWAARGACVGQDPDLFFPRRGESTAVAEFICTGCPVRVECLEYALDAGEKFGIWGGVSERGRRRIRRQRRSQRGAA